ncbi:S46 family peptidase [Alistipes sp.]|uniref:S46 family peptidase n=1 Tax=Alistipes sp. TaxID=1872444 RepID=UPI003AF11D6E
MKRWFIWLVVLLPLAQPVAADEGMWLVNSLEGIYPRMRKAGLKIDLKAIYNEQEEALADAVVAVDGGAGTGSMISEEGLMITNHHVAYSDICALSTPERNYLETGFWATERADEIPVPGKTVSFLRRVEDVTAEAEALRAGMQAAGRWGMMSMRRLYADLEKRHGEGTDCEVSCASIWGGRRYLMYYYDVYRDVRLVGAPPVSIGAFGGDYDNWGWPQHKGDFALYRVYADADGRPAEYAADNVPLRPRRVLRIAAGGVGEGDFTMVVGFPGHTNRYASSQAIRERERIKNPIVVGNRHDRMAIIRRHMERDPKVRMAYSDAFFSLSNYADYAKWETKCLRRFDVAERRRQEEQAMQRWIEADTARRTRYGGVLGELERGYAARREAERDLNYFREAWLGPSEALLVANRVSSFLGKLDRTGRDSLRLSDRDAQAVVAGSGRLKRNYDPATDCDLLARMAVNFTAHVPRGMWGETLCAMYDAAGGDADRMAREAFDRSFCATAARYDAYFSRDRSVAEIRRDPLVALTESVRVQRFTGEVDRAEKRARVKIGPSERRYAEALYDFRAAQGVPQYPDANSTMRLSYGTVRPLSPADGIHYDARSTVAGYLEKYDPGVYEWRVDERLRRLVEARAWGRWGEDGTLHVDFLTDNDITGGNSGSPVLDARGRLVGLAFDGNRESMAGDVWFHPELARTVSVDIRYVMWVIEHYAGAGQLLREMRFEK